MQDLRQPFDTTADRRLDDTDDLLIGLLVAGRGVGEAARELGVDPCTIYRRQRKPAFRAALAEARAGLWRPDAERMRSEVARSLDRLVALRDGENVHDSTRLRAAVAIIEMSLKLHELVDTQPRLGALEVQLAELFCE